jgi:hypothetical protein
MYIYIYMYTYIYMYVYVYTAELVHRVWYSLPCLVVAKYVDRHLAQAGSKVRTLDTKKELI